MNFSFTAFGFIRPFDLDSVCRGIRIATAGQIECAGTR
jgi:hypothetical protein